MLRGMRVDIKQIAVNLRNVVRPILGCVSVMPWEDMKMLGVAKTDG